MLHRCTSRLDKDMDKENFNKFMQNELVWS